MRQEATERTGEATGGGGGDGWGQLGGVGEAKGGGGGDESGQPGWLGAAAARLAEAAGSAAQAVWSVWGRVCGKRGRQEEEDEAQCSKRQKGDG